MDTSTPQYRRRHGDRKDGRLIRSLAPFYTFVPFIMKDRNDASNFFSDSFDISAADAYLRRKREEGLKGVGILHLFIAAYVRTAAQFPGINRFVSGQRIYARNNIEIVMTVKRRLAIDSDETTFKLVLEPTDGIEEIFRKMTVEIDKIKSSDEGNGTEKYAS